MLGLWITFFVGIWFVLSGFIPGLTAAWNAAFFGIVTLLVGFLTYSANRKYRQSLTNALIGLWMLVSGAILGLAVWWNFILFGLIMAIIGLRGARASAAEPVATT